MIETILARLIVMVQTVTGIKSVKRFSELNPTDGYPYAYVLYNGDESEELNNVEDRVTYEFDIFLIQEKLEDFKGREAAETTSINRSYTIAEALRADNDLSTSGVLRVRPLRTEKTYVEGGTRIQLKITLLVETVETVTA